MNNGDTDRANFAMAIYAASSPELDGFRGFLLIYNTKNVPDFT
jgi:hypothetical protein